MTSAQEEIFCPVLSVLPFDDIEQAVAMVNDSRYGLTASIWSNDLGRVMDLNPRIEAGTVWVNNHVPVDPNMPFGGYKQIGDRPRVRQGRHRRLYRKQIGVHHLLTLATPPDTAGGIPRSRVNLLRHPLTARAQPIQVRGPDTSSTTSRRCPA